MYSGYRGKMRVGVLGGSFNPAHEGHHYLSVNALKYLGLDQVWWLVTPGNPLKDNGNLPSLAARVSQSRQIATHPRIKVMDIEQEFGVPYTYNTLNRLKKRCPHIQFIWLMGSDNLCQFHRWQRWQRIFKMVPVAIFDRNPAIYQAISSKSSQFFRRYRKPNPRSFNTIGRAMPPAWVYLPLRRHRASSTALRKH